MRIIPLILAAIALLLPGCVATDLRVTNRTGTVIHLYSGHTKKIATIAAGSTKTVPHTTGKVIFITGGDEVWEYHDIQSIGSEATRGYKRLSLHVSVASDGTITLPSGKTLMPTHRLGKR